MYEKKLYFNMTIEEVINSLYFRGYDRGSIKLHMIEYYDIELPEYILDEFPEVGLIRQYYIKQDGNLDFKRNGVTSRYRRFMNSNGIEGIGYGAIHHIFPVVYRGVNLFENLVSVSDFQHDILHSNPFEHIEKYCNIAVDYLSFLYSFSGNIQMMSQYKDLFNSSDNITEVNAIRKILITKHMTELYNIFKNEVN